MERYLVLCEQPGDTEHVSWERKVKCQGHRSSCWIGATITKRISVMLSTAVVLSVSMQNMEDCCIHHKEAYVRALRSGGKGNLSRACSDAHV